MFILKDCIALFVLYMRDYFFLSRVNIKKNDIFIIFLLPMKKGTAVPLVYSPQKDYSAALETITMAGRIIRPFNS